jgi:Glyoxalase/Bleomycin resistance protein/Dioxygenase superfamily
VIRVAVRDLEAAARAHSTVYGIQRWRLNSLGPAGGGMGWGDSATGSNAHGLTIRLVRDPDFLAARGEGIHSLRLPGEPVPQVAFGGWSVDFGPAEEPAGGEWTVERADPPPVEIERLWHVGIAVRDIGARLSEYSAALGVPHWNVVELRPEGATLDGEPVEHAFLIARAPVAGFELEVIQPTQGPTHYARGLLDPIGDGAHHVLAWPSLTDASWAGLRDWMASRDVPVAMSGRVRGGAAEFFYLDTRRLLGGYLLEAIVRRD